MHFNPLHLLITRRLSFTDHFAQSVAILTRTTSLLNKSKVHRAQQQTCLHCLSVNQRLQSSVTTTVQAIDLDWPLGFFGSTTALGLNPVLVVGAGYGLLCLLDGVPAYERSEISIRLSSNLTMYEQQVNDIGIYHMLHTQTQWPCNKSGNIS